MSPVYASGHIGGNGGGGNRGMFNTGDLVPQQSGSASIGARQNGFHGFNDSLLPYAHMHINSGCWHHALGGQSGVIRLAPKNDLSYKESHDGIVEYHTAGNQTCFELSVDGGDQFPLRLGATRVLNNDEAGKVQHAVIRTQDANTDSLLIYSSGFMEVVGGNGLKLLAFPTLPVNGITIFAPTVDASSSEQTSISSVGSINIDGGILGGRPSEPDRGDVFLKAFQGSGWLHFRHNVPYESWYMRSNVSQGIGGPFGNGEWPIAHSGNINEMINRAIDSIPGGNTDLQSAYDNGNEIDHRKDLIGYKGVVIRETTPGLGGFTSNVDIATNKPGKYGIAVSGHTLTPTDVNSYGFAALNSLSLVITSSGSVSRLSRNFFLGYSSNPTFTDQVFFNTNGSLQFAVGDTTGTGLGGQIQLDAFASSGRMQYRFGPHQGWYAKLTHAGTGGPSNDGFWPISHSGQMLEQIVRRSKARSMTIERPAVNNDLTWFYTKEAITITEVESVCRGTFDASGQFAIRYSTDRSLAGTELTTNTITCTNRTTGQITTSFAAPNVPANSWVWVAVSGVSGVATAQLGITINYN